MFKVQRINKPIDRIVKEDGTSVSSAEKHYIEGVMKMFINAKVLGGRSPITKHAALRMALVAIEYRQETCCNGCKFGERSVFGGDPIKLHPQTDCPLH